MKRNNDSKIVIFDWGGVIESHKDGEYSWNVAIQKLLKRFNNNLDKNNIVKKYLDIKVDVANKYANDKDKEIIAFKRIKEEFKLNCNIEEFQIAHDEELDKVKYYEDVVKFAHSLKRYCEIGILSTLGREDKKRLDKQVDLKQFDYVWLSFELNCKKPDAKIYEIVQKDCNISPENIFFIDDDEKNLKVPSEMGWKILKATGNELDIIKKKVNEFIGISDN